MGNDQSAPCVTFGSESDARPAAATAATAPRTQTLSRSTDGARELLGALRALTVQLTTLEATASEAIVRLSARLDTMEAVLKTIAVGQVSLRNGLDSVDQRLQQLDTANARAAHKQRTLLAACAGMSDEPAPLPPAPPLPAAPAGHGPMPGEMPTIGGAGRSLTTRRIRDGK